MAVVGSQGYNWSSTISNTNGMLLEFRAQFLITSYAIYRAFGFQLRCLSE
ncbi:hypothetical protein [uncultured Rikenella sp.]|nr:hypothetical protein [uncultured Rikenella sp.]